MGKVGMDSKVFVVVSLAIITLVGTVTIILLENDSDSLTAEINELEKQQSAYPGKSTFVGGDMQFLEKWCIENKGFWKEIRPDRGECGFETRTQYHLASAVLDDLRQPEITGKPAQEICRFLALKCFSNSSFDGYYEIDTGKTFVNYDYKGVEYRFDVSDEDNITFTTNKSQESFNLSESTTLDDKFSIQVKIGYDYYQLGDKIAVSGMVQDNHHMLSQATFEYPVTIQIITDGELVEVAQLDVREDGQFQYTINTGGHVWKSGEYTIRTTYDSYTATTAFDLDKEPRNLLENKTNMLQNSDMNKKLVELLEQGKILEFNNLKETLNLNHSYVHLEGANLQGMDMREVDLNRVRLFGANMQGANLSEMIIDDDALHRVNLQNADLRKTDLGGSYLYDANLKNTNLQGANLKGAHLQGADLTGANLADSDVSGVRFIGSTIYDTNFQNANLQGSDLSKMDLLNINFEGADMQYANLKLSNLQNSDLENANLFSANLESANLRYVNLSGANMDGVNLNYANLLSSNLQNVKNLPISDEQARERGAIVYPK